ncbi:MAG: hypothetical protein A4S09_11370 [Proteobacteria bacterium SG_bin7]|nr:MAG: hypothetical protein A4S09_11370 [Proteobacteria bacterium SG_bin7]
MRVFSLALLVFGVSVSAFARGGGGGGGGSMHIGVGLGLITAGQDDLNSIQQRDNAANTISTPQLGSAYEFSGSFGYRFSGTIYELMFRPSYFWHSATGGTTGGAPYEYGVKGLMLYPIFRLYPLENAFMKFFFQFGVGYGKLYGTVKENTYTVEFEGSSFGYLAGLGVEMCMTDSHCFILEGNLRGSPAERSLVTSVSGTQSGAIWGNTSTSVAVGQEIEMDNRDLKITGSGILANIGYVMRF